MEIVAGSTQWWTVFFGGVCTLAIFSFLFGENIFYRVFEHFYIGIATAYGIMTQIREFLWPKVLVPLLGLDRAYFPDGTYAQAYDKRYLLFILPMIFGALYYFILSRRHAWIAQIVIGFSFGVAAGLAFKGIFVEILPQIFDSFRPLYALDENNFFDAKTSLSNVIFVFTLVSAMSYFFFTFQRRKGGLVERLSLTGRWMLMGCFGAFFGSTIMARMALLVERLDFLINRWWPVIF